MEILYPARFEPQVGGGFSVRFVDIPGAVTEGDTEEEALFNAAEALTGMLYVMMRDGDAIPPPSQNVPDARYVAPDAKTQAALLVRLARGDTTSLAVVARALDTSWAAARRLEAPDHWPSLKTLDRAAAALGKRLVLSFS
jgi:antitoxin HicB